MAGKLTFQISVYQTNAEILPQLANKAKDLTDVFNDIIKTWAELNKQKFQLAEGGESAGAQIFDVFWQPLSFKYLQEKLRHYPTNTLMVRTGSLAKALTDPDGFFRMVNPEQAIFGTPNDAEDAMKVQGNWDKRQAIFLSDADQNMIRQKVSQHFTIQMQSTKQSIAQMDAEFQGTAG